MRDKKTLLLVSFHWNGTDNRTLKEIKAIQDHFRITQIFPVKGKTEKSRLFHSLPIRVPVSASLKFQMLWFWCVAFWKSCFIKADCVQAQDLYSLPVAVFVAWKNRAKLIYDCHEYFPYVTGIREGSWKQKFWQWLEKRFIGKADLIFTVSPSIQQALKSDYGVTSFLLRNVPEPILITPYPIREELGLQASDKLVLFMGNLAQGRGLEKLVDTLKEISNFHWLILGDGPLESQLLALAERYNVLPRLHFMGMQSLEKALAIGAACDVGYCVLENTSKNNFFSLSNKFFEYIWMGIPVLFSDFPDMSDINRIFSIGKSVQQQDQIARALQELTTMSIPQKHFSQAKLELNWEKEKTIYVENVLRITQFE